LAAAPVARFRAGRAFLAGHPSLQPSRGTADSSALNIESR